MFGFIITKAETLNRLLTDLSIAKSRNHDLEVKLRRLTPNRDERGKFQKKNK